MTPKEFAFVSNLAQRILVSIASHGKVPRPEFKRAAEYAVDLADTLRETLRDTYGDVIEFKDADGNPIEEPWYIDPPQAGYPEDANDLCYSAVYHKGKVYTPALNNSGAWHWLDVAGYPDSPAAVPSALYRAMGEVYFYSRLEAVTELRKAIGKVDS